MTFKEATDGNTGSATKFGAPDLNKITQMLNGKDITDTVTIHQNVFWKFSEGALQLYNTAKTYLLTIKTGAQTGNYNLSIPVLSANDTIETLGTAQTVTGAKTFTSDITISATKKLLLSASTWLIETSSNVFDLFVNSVSKLNITNTLAKFQNLDLAISATQKLFYDGGGDTYAVESSANNLDVYVGGTKVETKTTTETINAVPVQMKGGLTWGKIGKSFEEMFQGKSIDTTNVWTQNNVSGTNTFAMETGIDSGFKITTQAVSGAKASINTGTIYHYNPTNCIIYGIMQYDNTSDSVYMGISNNIDPSSASTHTIACRMNTSTTYVELVNSNGTSQTVTATTTAKGTANLPFKIIATATSIKLYLLVANVWTLSATSSTNLPSSACSPVFMVANNSTTSQVGRAIYLRVDNG